MFADSRVRIVAFLAACLLFASCDKTPAGPTPPPSVPGPVVQRSIGPIAFVSDRDGTPAIYLANEDGTTVTRLTEGLRPSWSPDGQRLAFGHNQGIHVINIDGSGLRRLARGWDPDWSPDGRTLVFQNICCDIGLVDVDASNERRLFDSGPYGSFSPDWSPDGERIVFTVGTYIDFAPLGLWSINRDGSGARHLGLLEGEWPAWSPDSTQIAMVTRQGIEVVNADGSGQRLRVTGRIADLDWAPNGRFVYSRFTSPDGRGRSRIFVSEGGVEQQLVAEAVSASRRDYSDYHVTWVR